MDDGLKEYLINNFIDLLWRICKIGRVSMVVCLLRIWNGGSVDGNV